MSASIWNPAAGPSAGILAPAMLTVKSSKYASGLITSVGAGNTINVTGYAKLRVQLAAPGTVSNAWFDASEADGADTGRNGELILEASNGNLTLSHTARGGAANTFVLLGGANITLVTGQVVRFLRSETLAQWQQV
jgi:hypothetical protein